MAGPTRGPVNRINTEAVRGMTKVLTVYVFLKQSLVAFNGLKHSANCMCHLHYTSESVDFTQTEYLCASSSLKNANRIVFVTSLYYLVDLKSLNVDTKLGS